MSIWKISFYLVLLVFIVILVLCVSARSHCPVIKSIKTKEVKKEHDESSHSLCLVICSAGSRSGEEFTLLFGFVFVKLHLQFLTLLKSRLKADKFLLAFAES